MHNSPAQQNYRAHIMGNKMIITSFTAGSASPQLHAGHVKELDVGAEIQLTSSQYLYMFFLV